MTFLRNSIGLLLLLQATADVSLAIGLSLGQCEDEVFKCQCGPVPGPTVDVTVSSCTFFYKWKPYCHACKNGQKISPSDVCPKYRRCAICDSDGESCTTCPTGTYGTFCDKSQTVSSSGVGGKSPGLLDINLSLGVLGGITGNGKNEPQPQAPPTFTGCRCLNGGHCRGFEDFCYCPAGFSGTYCEKSATCKPLPPTPPASIEVIPKENPQYMEYSCPSRGYLLEGSSRLTCIKETGHWSHPPPICVPACTVPDPPDNGWSVNVSKGALVKSGESVEFKCGDGLVLIGTSKITCMADTNWSHMSPSCVKAIMCPEPQPVAQATYRLQVPPFQPPFTNGTLVIFSCTGDHLLMGQAEILCKDDGQWSSAGPTCVKVLDSEVNCETKGSEVVDDVATPVRVHCPPSCAAENGSVWGTIIYEEESSVCRAAVHSGRITDALGGSLFIINNGQYNDFLGSTMNGITSSRKRGLSNSFRFHHDPDLEEQNRDGPDKGCPRGWTEVTGHCIYVVPKKRAWEAARGICTNMGSRLPNLRDPSFVRDVLRVTTPQSDVQSFWLISKREKNDSQPVPLWARQGMGLNPELASRVATHDVGKETNPLKNGCVKINQLQEEPLWTPVECDQESAFICDIDLRQYQVTCPDIGAPENGFATLQDPDRGFRRGAVLKFQCEELHILQGEPMSACLPDGTWSAPLPQCRRIPACVSPPQVKFGSFQILLPLPASNSRIARPQVPGIRRGRIGSAIPQRQVLSKKDTTNKSDDALPPVDNSNSSFPDSQAEKEEVRTTADISASSMSEGQVTRSMQEEEIKVEPLPTADFISSTPPGGQIMGSIHLAEKQVEVAPPPSDRTITESEVRFVQVAEGSEELPPVGRVPLLRQVRNVPVGSKEEQQELPPGHFKVGSRASYACESRYYDLVGSQTRRCQADGSWSGRPVTCIPVCGRSDSPRTPFITHGNSSDVGQWPWQVGVAHNLPGTDTFFLLCGGALINENWVLTAAHCATDEKTGLPLEPNQIRLYAGKYHRSDRRDDNFVQVRQASEVHVHPDYDPNLYDADIALIRMDNHVTLTSRVQPVCLPTDTTTRQNLVDGKKGVVIGWGLTESSEYAETLRHAVLPVVSHERCEAGYQEADMPLTVSENMYCAGMEEGRTDACSGDSGGPMVFQMEAGARKYWVLEGIVSWGSLTGCGNARQYGGFTKVNQFLDWIYQYV